MRDNYFSDREMGQGPRITEEISQQVWGGIVSNVQSRVSTGAFGIDFPEQCPDPERPGCIATDSNTIGLALQAEIQDVFWPLDVQERPPLLGVLDLLEFCYSHVAEPIQRSFHKFYDHYHLTFDREAGQLSFRDDVNRIFARNGIAFQLSEKGCVERLLPPGLHELVTETVISAGDSELDEMLETAISKIVNADVAVRREAIEKLWDAWERLKTLEPGKDKKDSFMKILNKSASEPMFRQVLEEEAQDLTDIGNQFQIRHSETSKPKIQQASQIDFLFHRLLSIIVLLLRNR